MKVLMYSTKAFEREIYRNVTHAGIDLNFTGEPLNHTTAQKAAGYKAVSLFSNDDASEPVLKVLYQNGVRFIALRSAGHDHISMEGANKLGIKVANVPAYSPNAIAEHAVMLILALNRKLIPAFVKNTKHDFRLDELIGFDMKGKTVGIIGTGRIGAITTKILYGFDCKLLAYDPKENEKLKSDYKLRYTDLTELYEQSDIITLHCPLNSSTRFMINATSIEKMKRGVMIINTGRGALINTEHAWRALESGQIGYLGLDVYEKEKGIFFNNHQGHELTDPWIDKILHHPLCILTAHQAFLTHTAVANMASTTVYNLTQWMHGANSPNELTSHQKINV